MTIQVHKLNLKNIETPEFEIEGSAEILISGNCSCFIIKAIGDSDFFPMTDSDGDEIHYSGDNPSAVIFNGTVVNISKHCKFKICLDDSVSAASNVEVTIAQGW